MKSLKNTIAILLAAVLLSGLLPAASAANGEAVLTSLGHRDTGTVPVNGAEDIITLTVPYRYPLSTVDLSNNLSIGYNKSRYKNVVASLDTPGDAVVDGDPVTLIVTFNNSGDPEGSEKSVTTYQVRVVRADAVAPTFSGTITKEVMAPNTVILTAADFLGNPSANPPIPPKYIANDGDPLSAVSITGTNPPFGTLMYGGDQYVFGEIVELSAINQLTFSPTATGTVSYDVKAYAGSDWTTPIGNVVLTITSFSSPVISSPISETVPKGTILQMNTAYFSRHYDLRGIPLVSLEITPASTSAGKWSYVPTPGSQPVVFTSRKAIPAECLDSLTFTAATPGTASFSWRVSTAAGTSSSSSGVITVTSATLTLSSSTAASILRGSSRRFHSGEFRYSPTTAAMTYVKITVLPPAAEGYLYLDTAIPKNDTYGYPAVAAQTALKANTIIPVSYLGSLCLATKTTATRDEISFKWTATADLKASTATWAEPTTFTVRFITGGTQPVYETDMNLPLALPASGISEEFSNLTGYRLSYVTFTLPDKASGALYLNYDMGTKKGTAVTSSAKYYTQKTPNLASVTFVPAADYFGTVKIKYNAYMDNGSFITSWISIYVRNYSGGTVALQTDKNTALQLDARAFQSAFAAATGKTLQYITFSNLSGLSGNLYYDYVSPGNVGTLVTNSNSTFYIQTAPYLARVAFMPAQDFTGQVSIYFNGYSKEGWGYYCKLVITVLDSPGGIVTYNLTENSYIQLSGNEFSNEFISVTGSILSYVTFTPPKGANGTLLYQYNPETKKGTAVTPTGKYYDGRNPDLSDLTFVPAKDFIGTVVIPYKGYTASGASYDGKVIFNVTEGSQMISYATESGARVIMNAADFQRAFYVLSDGKRLSHVKFTLPPSNYGRLYYAYNARNEYDSLVTADQKYYLDAAPYLSVVSFVPADTYSGSFILTYTGYSTTGEAYTGKVRISVTAPAATGSVNYSTNSLTPVTFSASHFTAAYKGVGTLSYVVFTLPSSSYGTLYYNYSLSSSYNTPVTSTTAYYVGGYPNISSITFVPNSSYSGSLAIPFTAYSTTGVSSPGTVVITVSSSDIATLTYKTPFNTPFQLSADDLNTALLSRSGSALHYVIFSLPPTSQGTLYLGYRSPNSYEALVTSTGRYYRSYSPLVSNVYFVPKTGYAGAVTLSYTGYSVGGTAYTGKIIITVESGVPFSDMKTGYDWAATAVSYLHSSGIVKGSDDGKYHPADNIKRGDFILMVTRAFGLQSYSTENFPDVPMGVYYYSAIASAKYYGIVTGSGGLFYPASHITRQDAMVIIARTLDVCGHYIAPGSEADLARFADASQISDYAADAMASLVRAGIITGSGGRLNPKANITRAEMAVMLYKVLTM